MKEMQMLKEEKKMKEKRNDRNHANAERNKRRTG
jgi:hypothetical protein